MSRITNFSGALSHEFGNRLAVVDDRRGAAVEIVDQRVGRIDAKMVIDRREEIARPAAPFDGVFAALVGCADEASCFNATAGPTDSRTPAAMVAAGLNGAGRGAGVARAGARRVTIFGVRPNSPVTTSITR